jgi:hypothetical protein
MRINEIHFFVLCIEQQLEDNKCSNLIRVYRAQLLANKEVQLLKYSLGGFLAINSFFSTSFDRQQARSFFLSAVISNEIMFII